MGKRIESYKLPVTKITKSWDAMDSMVAIVNYTVLRIGKLLRE